MKEDKRLICITGADGTGKSTLVNALHALDDNYIQSNIWDLLNSSNEGLPFKSKREIDVFLCGLTPDSRLLFLSHALKYSIDKAIESCKSIVFINGYYYKYFATELALGASPQLVKDLQKSFPKSDTVIHLELPLIESAQRKQALSYYECGLSERNDTDSFIKFQQKVLAHWETFDRTDWHTLNTKDSEEINFEKAKQILDL